MCIVDAHEDIAWNVFALGRDVRRSAFETRRLEEDGDTPQRGGLCMVGLPEWLSGGVAIVLGTIFVVPARRGLADPHVYTTAEEAHALAQAQLDFYHRLAGECDQITLIGNRADLDGVLASWERENPRVGIVLLMEGADPIREPSEAEAWFERGVRLVSLSWQAGSRYAGGNAVPGPLTGAGRELLAAMADLGLVLDVSEDCEAGDLTHTTILQAASVDPAANRFDGIAYLPVFPDGSFDGVIGLAPGENRVSVAARGPGGIERIAERVVVFERRDPRDAAEFRAAREKLARLRRRTMETELSLEIERIRSAEQDKQLVLEPGSG